MPSVHPFHKFDAGAPSQRRQQHFSASAVLSDGSERAEQDIKSGIPDHRMTLTIAYTMIDGYSQRSIAKMARTAKSIVWCHFCILLSVVRISDNRTV